ncbi:unnamed protein product, partial [Ranitomeya imitator]
CSPRRIQSCPNVFVNDSCHSTHVPLLAGLHRWGLQCYSIAGFESPTFRARTGPYGLHLAAASGNVDIASWLALVLECDLLATDYPGNTAPAPLGHVAQYQFLVSSASKLIFGQSPRCLYSARVLAKRRGVNKEVDPRMLESPWKNKSGRVSTGHSLSKMETMQTAESERYVQCSEAANAKGTQALCLKDPSRKIWCCLVDFYIPSYFLSFI